MGNHPSRTFLLLLALAAVGVYVWLAAQVLRSRAGPETFRAWDGARAWIVGPPPRSLGDAANRHVERALELLNDISLPADRRLAGYRRELRQAERLLLDSLRAQPSQARALAHLAAVRFELDPPASPQSSQRHLELIELASRSAPTVAGVQSQLGELLLKMGDRTEAIGYLRRSVELDPTQAPAVIEMLRSHLFAAEEILQALPRHPIVLASLRQPYVQDGAQASYLDVLETELRRPDAPATAAVLRAYGDTCLELDRAEVLLAGLERLGPSTDASTEAERLRQRSRAFLALDDPEHAVADARRAREQRPAAPHLAGHEGVTLLAAGRPEQAIVAFRDALRLTARTGGPPGERARLYRRIGQAEESRGELGRAYDAYKLALELDPGETVARKRVDEMENAASPR